MNHYRLNNGVEIPVLGFGTWKAADGEEAYQAVLAALKSRLSPYRYSCDLPE